MMQVSVNLNGKAVSAEVEPRTSLADFVREHFLLTGTHLGCEHGICGACTVLIEGEPARACIRFAATCQDREVQTIEGLADDAVMTALRAAFTAEHALQCGYCTPGMLVTARDIVRRLPDADDDRVRLELAGNLCRCTGYVGIVRAIRRVLDQRLDVMAPQRPNVPLGKFDQPAGSGAPIADHPSGSVTEAAPSTAGGEALTQRLDLALSREVVWQALRDPALIASCVPGARLTSVEDGRIAGELVAALGPIEARFSGTATVRYDGATFSGRIEGQGGDRASGSRLDAAAEFRVDERGAQTSTVVLEITYALRGALAQVGRGPIVRVFATEIAETVGRNLEARLRGEAVSAPPRRLGAGTLIMRAIWRRLAGLLSRRP
jgi:aerobic carbon-monoxide dehydrogenase small subunit